MYKIVKAIQWAITFVFLLIFYRWMIPDLTANFLAAAANITLFIVITETFIHYRAVPFLFLRDRYKLFVAVIVLCILLNGALTLFLTWLIIQPFTNSHFQDLFWSWENLIYGNFFVVAAFTAISLAVKLTYDSLSLQKRLRRMEIEKAKAELEVLKAQLNPHFLFNSLNSIYGHIDKGNSEARHLLVRFSDLLRYQLYECDTDFVAIEKEIEYLESYVEVQKRRKSHRAQIEFRLSGCLSGYRVAPLIFIPFVENAFKFMSGYDDAENYLVIDLNGGENALHFKCVNSKESDSKTGLAEKLSKRGGMGIENARRRLQLIYPDRHRLAYNNDDKEFSVELLIEL